MSRATKRKHVLLEANRDDFSLPTENQQIVRVLSNRGNNLHEVESTDKKTFLASMPTKFRKTMWVKRGNFVLVEPIEEGNKVKAEIVRILTKEHIKYFKEDNVWPEEFVIKEQKDNSNDDELFVNPNRPVVNDEDSELECTSDSSEGSSDDGDDECSNGENRGTESKLD